METESMAEAGGLSGAAATDKIAAELQFFSRIKEHALADARGLARKEISEKLRSKRWAKDWSAAIGNLRAQTNDKALGALLVTRALEAAELKRKYAIEGQGDTSSISAKVQHDYGFDFLNGRTLHEMQILLLCEILQELRND